MKNYVRTAALAVDGVHLLYDRWQKSYLGTMEDFYRFMTVPSFDRSVFVSSLEKEREVFSGVVSVIVKA